MDCEVRFLPEGKRSLVPTGSTVMVAALKAGVDLANICGGKGFCGKCLVEVLEGKVPPPTDQERKRISPEKIAKGYRLACQVIVQEDMTVQIPEQSRVGRQKLVIMGKEPPTPLKPNVRKVYVELVPPSLQDPEGDDVRLAKTLAKIGYGHVVIDYEVLKSLPKVLRDGGWKVTLTILNGQEIVNVQPGDRTKELYGVAVDIGTTKVAVFIVDLLDGGIVFADGIMNPQIRYGEDVISRIGYASQSDESLSEVKKVIIDGINSLIDKGLRETGVKEEDLYELVAVGNTAMHHLFLGLNVRPLGFSPYPPAAGRSYNVKARDLGIRINPAGNVHTLPNVAGFVGADAIADILASRIYEKVKLTLLMDVGTNTEVVLGNKEGLWACSTASGPAFEGAHIKYGMRAASGAIEKIKIKDDFDVEYSTIDGEKARGICGSGIIDAVAEMLRTGIIDMSGKIVLQNHKRVREGADGREFVLVFKEDTASGKEDIVITQEDVREVQKAKAAMYAGYMTLMRKSGFMREELSEIIIAGAFGNYIDPENARMIGMIPELPISSISFLGNTAGSGARMCLKSTESRREAEVLAERIKYVELAAEPIFEEEYVNAMYMPNSRLEDFPEVVSNVKAPRVVKRYVRR